MKKLRSIAFGTWSWETGEVGGDQVFGNHLDEQMLRPVLLRPVFEAVRKESLNLWDTTTVCGMV